MLVWLLFLLVTSAFGRTAVDDQEHVSNNLITDTKPVQTGPTINHEETNTLDNNISSQSVNESIKYNVLPLSQNADLRTGKDGNNVNNGTALIMTQFIKEGKVNDARNACKVDPKLFLGFKSYSGFLTVNETYNSNLFFWYFPVLNKNVSDSPWIIWLQGGPGISSLMGLFDEIGPFTYKNGGLRPNPYTWLRNHSLLFIDNPVGTGYSFTDHDDGYPTGEMSLYSSHLYTALKQFLQIFPELKTAPLYIAGESYAGHYVPSLAMEIHKGKDELGGDINFQGMLLGNAMIDPDMIRIPWPFYYTGMLERKQIDSLKPLEEAMRQDFAANRSIEAKIKWQKLCMLLLYMTHQKQAFNYVRDDMETGKYVELLQRTEIKRALHVGDIHYSLFNATVGKKMEGDFLSTTKPMMEILLEHYKAIVYCGHLDLMLACVFSSEFYRTWRWGGAQEFLRAARYPYVFKNRLSGYHKSGGNLTEVVVLGAGHMVPYDVPAPAQNMIAQWTHGQPISPMYHIYDGPFLRDYMNKRTANSAVFLPSLTSKDIFLK